MDYRFDRTSISHTINGGHPKPCLKKMQDVFNLT